VRHSVFLFLYFLFFAHRSVHLGAIAKKAGCDMQDLLFFDNQRNNIDVAR
jgi:hypothetical protein